MTAPTPLRVLVADDDHLLRTALAQVLALRDGIEVVGEAGDGAEAVARIRELEPDIALVDLDMPEADGIEVAEAVRGVLTHVVIITRHARPAQLQRALAAAASGFILKSTSSDRLMAILADIGAGHRYVDPEIASLALTMRPCPLTDREREVLARLHAGERTSEIAQSLHLAPGTVRNYVSSAMARLNADSGREAAALAHDEGWI